MDIWEMNYDGTSTVSYHAEHVHGKLPKVISYLEQTIAKKEAALIKKRYENQALKTVGAVYVAALIARFLHYFLPFLCTSCMLGSTISWS